MEEDSAFHFIIGSFIVLFSFHYLFPGAELTLLVTWAVAILALAYLAKGFIVAAVGGEYDTFWAGCAIALMLVIFFNGLPIFSKIIHKLVTFIGVV